MPVPPPMPPYYIGGPSHASSQRTSMSSLADSWRKMDRTQAEVMHKEESDDEKTVEILDLDQGDYCGLDTEDDFNSQTFFGETGKENLSREEHPDAGRKQKGLGAKKVLVAPGCQKIRKGEDGGKKQTSQETRKELVVKHRLRDTEKEVSG